MVYKLKIRAKYGEVEIPFETLEDLKEKIQNINLEDVNKIVTEKFKNVVWEMRQPKPGFEDIYRFTIDGLVELITIPSTKAETVALVLFAYSPVPASTQQIDLSSGVKGSASLILTHPSYKKYFNRTEDGKYILTQEGLDWVINKIIPKLRQKVRK